MPLLLSLKRNYSNNMTREVMSVHQAAAGPIPDISQQPPPPTTPKDPIQQLQSKYHTVT